MTLHELHEAIVRAAQNLDAGGHIEEVLEAAAAYCEELGNHAAQEMHNAAISNEWQRAAMLIREAIGEVGQ